MTPANEFPGNIIYFLLLLGFGSFFVWAATTRAQWLFKAQPLNRLNDFFWRIGGMLPDLLGNRRVARRNYWYSGILHSLIWWGFIVLQIRTLNFLLNGIDHDISFEGLVPRAYDVLRPIMDAFNVLVLIGVAMAAFQRFFWKPKRMTLNMDGWIILFFIGWLMVTDIFVNSLEFYLHPDIEAFETKELSFVAYGLYEFWVEIGLSESTAEALNVFFWYAHLIDFLAFLCYLPFSKHSHVLTIAPQVFFRRAEPTGVLAPIKDIEQAETFGVGKLESFNWKQLLDSYTCTECGRCTDACPANLTGKLLSPKHVIVDIRHLMEEQMVTPGFLKAAHAGDKGQVQATVAGDAASAPAETDAEKHENGANGHSITPLIEGVGFEPIWDCVTCGACMEACPVFIEHVPTIMDMRRYLVMEESNMPETAVQTLMQLEQRGHPWRGTQLTRTTWIEELAAEGTEVPLFDGTQEYLYWVGCTGALQERNVKVTKSLVRLFLQAGVSFGVLAMEEGCSGDPARRLGNEYLYQMQAEMNIEVFRGKNVQNVIANCPHCYNTIKHEYPQFSKEGAPAEFETIHHSVFLADLVAQGKLNADQVDPAMMTNVAAGNVGKTVTYHDPCYISRHNNIIDEPRSVLAATGSRQVEMPRCKKGTFCCGAGGSHMWVEENRGERINVVRTEEAVATGADVIAVSCPFCMQMFESGLGAVPAAEERGVQVFDLAELLEMSVAYSRPAGATNGSSANGGNERSAAQAAGSDAVVAGGPVVEASSEPPIVVEPTMPVPDEPGPDDPGSSETAVEPVASPDMLVVTDDEVESGESPTV
jgi:Fe-S oxidoreductase